MDKLTKEQEVKLWAIKLAGYDYYGTRFDTASLKLAESIRKQIDSILIAHGCDPVVLVH